jgi:hypothetical protein
MKLTNAQSRVLFLCAALALITVVVYSPVWDEEFVKYDNDVYITENPHLQDGLTS